MLGVCMNEYGVAAASTVWLPRTPQRRCAGATRVFDPDIFACRGKGSSVVPILWATPEPDGVAAQRWTARPQDRAFRGIPGFVDVTQSDQTFRSVTFNS